MWGKRQNERKKNECSGQESNQHLPTPTMNKREHLGRRGGRRRGSVKWEKPDQKQQETNENKQKKRTTVWQANLHDRQRVTSSIAFSTSFDRYHYTFVRIYTLCMVRYTVIIRSCCWLRLSVALSLGAVVSNGFQKTDPLPIVPVTLMKIELNGRMHITFEVGTRHCTKHQCWRCSARTKFKHATRCGKNGGGEERERRRLKWAQLCGERGMERMCALFAVLQPSFRLYFVCALLLTAFCIALSLSSSVLAVYIAREPGFLYYIQTHTTTYILADSLLMPRIIIFVMAFCLFLSLLLTTSLLHRILTWALSFFFSLSYLPPYTFFLSVDRFAFFSFV